MNTLLNKITHTALKSISKALPLRGLGGLLVCALLASCDKDVFDIGSDPAEGTTFKSYETSPISNVLESDSDFTAFTAVIRHADLYNALNQSSDGVSFTVFAPNNKAIQTFEQQLGTKITDQTKDYARSFVLYHCVKDSILPDAFINKTFVTNLTKDKINIAIDTINAGQAILTNSNSRAQVIEMGRSASNGKIYVLSSALTPLVETVYDRIAKNTDYSLLLQAMDATGWSNKLNTITDTTYQNGTAVVTSHSYTVLGVTNATFQKAGISSLDQLKSKLSADNKEGISADSLLRAYVGYHILPSKSTMATIGAVQGSELTRLWSTSADNLVFTMTTDTTKTDVASRYTFNASSDAVHFVEANSDVLALNGYVHQLDNWMPVWEPSQQTVIWDFADNNIIKDLVNEAEVDYQPSVVPTKQQKVKLNNASCFDYTQTDSKNTSFDYIDYYTVTKFTDKAIELGAKQANNYDCIVFNLGNTGTASMKTPTIVRGKYKVMLDIVYTTSHNFMRQKTDGSGGTIEVSFDGTNKKYVAPYTQVTQIWPGVYQTVLYDEIEFDSTSSHTFSFKIKDGAASTNKSFSLQFDTMTFIPVAP